MNKYKNKYAQKLEDKAREKLGKGSEEESGVSSDEPSDDTSSQDNTNDNQGSKQQSKRPKTKQSGGNMRKWLMGLLAMVLIASLVFNVMSWQQAQQTNDKLAKIEKKVQNTDDGIVAVYSQLDDITGETSENVSNDTDDGKTTKDKLSDIITKVDSLQASHESFAKEQRERNEDMQEKIDGEVDE